MKHSLSIIAAAACLLANSAWSQEHAIHSGALDFPALGAVEGQSDISALIDRRWRAEATYRTSLAEYLAAYKEMAASYEKVIQKGKEVGILREAAGPADAMNRQLAAQARTWLAGEVAKKLGAAAIPTLLNVAQIAEIMHWIEIDIVPAAIKNRIINIRRFKPAVRAVERSSRSLEEAKGRLYSTLRGARSLTMDHQTVGGMITGRATPGSTVVAYIATNRPYEQGRVKVGQDGSWSIRGYPTRGVVNVVYAVEFDSHGRAVSFSGEREL